MITDSRTQRRMIDLEGYKNELNNNSIKLMIYAVGKEFGDLNMAKSLSTNDLYEAFASLSILNKGNEGR